MTTFYFRVHPGVHVIDGDSLRLTLDLGMRVSMETDVRLLGVDTPELHGSTALEREAAQLVRRWIWDRLEKDPIALVESHEMDKYGRLLADIKLESSRYLNSMLLDRGFARPYGGEKKEPWTEAQLQAIIDFEEPK